MKARAYCFTLPALLIAALAPGAEDKEPKVIDPGPPPSDALVLFDGKDLSRWKQTDDIIFHAPKTGADGKVEPGSFTVLHNGVLVQDHIPVKGDATTGGEVPGNRAERASHVAGPRQSSPLPQYLASSSLKAALLRGLFFLG